MVRCRTYLKAICNGTFYILARLAIFKRLSRYTVSRRITVSILAIYKRTFRDSLGAISILAIFLSALLEPPSERVRL